MFTKFPVFSIRFVFFCTFSIVLCFLYCVFQSSSVVLSGPYSPLIFLIILVHVLPMGPPSPRHVYTVSWHVFHCFLTLCTMLFSGSFGFLVFFLKGLKFSSWSVSRVLRFTCHVCFLLVLFPMVLYFFTMRFPFFCFFVWSAFPQHVWPFGFLTMPFTYSLFFFYVFNLFLLLSHGPSGYFPMLPSAPLVCSSCFSRVYWFISPTYSQHLRFPYHCFPRVF